MATPYNLIQCPIFKEAGDYLETSAFGYRVHPVTGKADGHTGSDGVREGHNLATIIAIADGEIIAVERGVEGYSDIYVNGNFVCVKHKNNRRTFYLHLAYGSIPDKIKIGAHVIKGEILGYMGATGRCTGAHVHFQVNDVDLLPIDPMPFLKGYRDVCGGGGNMYIKVEPCKYGDTGGKIVNLQNKLCQFSEELDAEIKSHSLNSYGELDGIFGRGLRSSVMVIQDKLGLNPTGEVDQTLCDLLNSDSMEEKAKLIKIKRII